ncbi:expressed unknown protein [Seminavis robusta]|uniref:Uncharacterized protein n=1 Tax=Seminavis robusta TaxID=568900 RepID=A0A9N8H4G7_9STRA|nr:expressed unknown protein [Seminavis robusta]|eukprot:Sro62_g035490.1 n/a (167) ;mRNA; r:104395-104895
MGNHTSALPLDRKNIPPEVLAMLEDEKKAAQFLADVQASFTVDSDSDNLGLDYTMHDILKAQKVKHNKNTTRGIKRSKSGLSSEASKATSSEQSQQNRKPHPNGVQSDSVNSEHSLNPQEIVGLLEQFATKDCDTGMAFFKALETKRPTSKYHNGTNANTKASKAA